MADRVSEQYRQSSDEIKNEYSVQNYRRPFKHMYLMEPISSL